MADDKVSEFLGSDSNIAMVPCLPEDMTAVKEGKLGPSGCHSLKKIDQVDDRCCEFHSI